MNHKELTAYAEILCNNYWVDLNKHPHLIDTVINHPDYSHMSQRNPWTIGIYFYCEGSPSGVLNFASIDVEKKEEILGKIDAITKALHC